MDKTPIITPKITRTAFRRLISTATNKTATDADRVGALQVIGMILLALHYGSK